MAYLDSLISKVSQKFTDLMPPPSPPMLGSGDDDDGVDAAEDSGVGAGIGIVGLKAITFGLKALGAKSYLARPSASSEGF